MFLAKVINWRSLSDALIIAIILLAIGLLLTVDRPTVRLVAALALTCLLPGWVIIERALPSARLSERLILGSGLSYALTIIGSLAQYYLTGQIGGQLWLIGYGLLAIGLLAWQTRRPVEHFVTTTATMSRFERTILILILLLAGYFCFYRLDYSDLRGDEAEVLLRATDLVLGQGDGLFSHTKGPAELLLTAAVGSLQGGFDELTARLPFALASWLSVAGLYGLGRALFRDPRIALTATAFWAINGWLVSHSRTAQYQTLILFLLVVGLWQSWQAMQDRRTVRQLLGGLCLATAMLAHYDGGMVALPILAYLGWRLWGVGQSNEKTSRLSLWNTFKMKAIDPQHRAFVGSLILIGLIVAAFYLPFLVSNLTSDTHESHLSRNFGTDQPYNNLEEFYINGLFYSSIYYVIGGAIVLLLGLWRGLVHIAPIRYRWPMALAVLPLLIGTWPGLLPNSYAVIIFSLLCLALIFTPRLTSSLKLLILWLILPLMLYLFLVIRPGNHFYVVQPALMLLAGAIIWQTGRDVADGDAWLSDKFVRGEVSTPPNPPCKGGREISFSLAGGGWEGVETPPALNFAISITLLILFALSTYHQHLVFMRTDLEYLLTYPTHRNPLYWSDSRYPFDIRIGWGFPYRLGWQTVATLYDEGQLSGDWYGNDQNNSIQWYTRNAPRNPCYPYNFFVTQQIGYKSPLLDLPTETIDQHYQPTDIVMVNGQERLHLYRFSPNLSSADAPTVYHEPRFDFNHTRQLALEQPVPTVPLTPPVPFKAHPEMLKTLVEVYNDPNLPQIKGQAVNLGYDLDLAWGKPGGVILLTLHWQAEGAIILPYKVFTHLMRDGAVFAQADHEPACDQRPTYDWRSGERITDRHAIFLPADLPLGAYELRIGLYELRTGLRMDRLDIAGAPAGTDLLLTTVLIEE